MGEVGYVYVLTNPSFKENWVKIGRSKRLSEERARELYNTAVPLPYEIYAILKTEKYVEAEKAIHRSIDRLSNLRINKSREFFNISPEDAYHILSDIKDLLGDEAVLELKGDNIEVKIKQNGIQQPRAQVFSFYAKGVKNGDIVTFVDDPNIKAVVISDRQVLFEDQTWYLSRLTAEIYRRSGKISASGAYQGPAFFLFKGKILTELPSI